MARPFPLLYADHHATTPVRPEVFEAMLPWLSGLAANPSSVHAPGRAARRAVEEAREKVARAIGGAVDEVVFTSGGTESDNLAIRGSALAARAVDASRVSVAVSAAEHPAVREAARSLAPLGFDVAEIAVDGNGLPEESAAEGLLTPRLALVSCLFAGNETGALDTGLPGRAARARAVGALVHTDAVQAVGKVLVSVADLSVDLLSLTAHKFGGPKGAGALWVRRGTPLVPMNAGGRQERGRRGGTENVAAIVGLGEAIRLATAELPREEARVASLRDRFETGLMEALPSVRFNSAGACRLPTVSSVVFPGASAETLVAALDLEGVAVSAGAACAAGTTTPSRVLLATGMAREEVLSTVRFSFGWTTVAAEIERLLEIVPPLVQRALAAT